MEIYVTYEIVPNGLKHVFTHQTLQLAVSDINVEVMLRSRHTKYQNAFLPCIPIFCDVPTTEPVPIIISTNNTINNDFYIELGNGWELTPSISLPNTQDVIPYKMYIIKQTVIIT